MSHDEIPSSLHELKLNLRSKSEDLINQFLSRSFSIELKLFWRMVAKVKILAKKYFFFEKSTFWWRWNFDEKLKFLIEKSKLLKQMVKCGGKIEILVKNRNFVQKSKFPSKIESLVTKVWSEIEILVKNRNFHQKSKLWSEIEILVKHRNFVQKSKIGQKWKFCSKIENWSKMEILLKNRKLGFLIEKFETIVKNTNFRFLNKISIFEKILIFDQSKIEVLTAFSHR